MAVDLPDLPNNEYMKVLEVNMLTSVFETLTGRHVQLPNTLLMTVPIENHSRSMNATFIMLFEVGVHTTTEQFTALSERILAYMRSKPLEWRSDLYSYCNTGNHERGIMELEFWMTHQLPWSEIDAVFASQSDLTLTIINIMTSLDFTFRKPTQPVIFNSALHADVRGSMAVAASGGGGAGGRGGVGGAHGGLGSGSSGWGGGRRRRGAPHTRAQSYNSFPEDDGDDNNTEDGASGVTPMSASSGMRRRNFRARSFAHTPTTTVPAPPARSFAPPNHHDVVARAAYLAAARTAATTSFDGSGESDRD